MSQAVLFEDEGTVRAGLVLSSTEASHLVELPTGKRAKVKAANVLLRFAEPPPAQLLAQAQAQADAIDLDFLWECAPQDEFGFDELARDYHGRAASAVEAAAILLRLHGAPVYFHRRGRGRYRSAPPDVLRAALAAVARRRQQDDLRQRYAEELKAGGLPAEIRALGLTLAIRPDRNTIECKALEQAAAELHLTPLRLLLARGAIASPYHWHVDGFFAQLFPRGTGFPAGLPAPSVPDLPLAEVRAFSIDDSATTEIDDAFSVQWLADCVRVGIHIAAPATAIGRGDALDAVARSRLSTVYAPGIKVTMLPPAWIDAFSLEAGRTVPVLSLYLDVDPGTLSVGATATRLERLTIAENLRHDRLDALTDEAALAAGLPGVPCARELAFLHRLARALLAGRERVRGRPEPVGRVDYSVSVAMPDGAAAIDPERADIRIVARQRGAPLDLLVAELMIFANDHWGGRLADAQVPGIYRSQSRFRGIGRVRMSTTPAPHEGLGVAHYAWSSSPLRRYVDLVNQRQLLALASGQAPPYAANDAELFAVVSAFDAAYGAYAEFQERLERYWCLRWLRRQQCGRIGATVLRGDVLRLDGLPLVTRLPGLPELPRGQRVELDLLGSDEVELALEARLHRVLAGQADVQALEEDDTSTPAAAAPENGAESAAESPHRGVQPPEPGPAEPDRT